MVTIRIAHEEDAAALGALHARSWKAAYRGIVPDAILHTFTPEGRTELFQKALQEAEGIYAIAFEGLRPAGFVCIGICRDEDKPAGWGEIRGLYLDPAFWRKGIGTKLAYWGINALNAQGYGRALLWVLEKNAAARAFYENIGFVCDGTVQQTRLGEGIRKCRYTMPIDNASPEQFGG